MLFFQIEELFVIYYVKGLRWLASPILYFLKQNCDQDYRCSKMFGKGAKLIFKSENKIKK